MNEDNFIELVNKEIDGIISIQGKRDLLHYLEKNPEANEKYHNLTRSIKQLDKLDEIEPPKDLKSRIMNSIDLTRYSDKQKIKRKIDFSLFDFLLTPKPKLAYAFTFGTVFGLLVYSIFIADIIYQNRIDPSDISGTMSINNLSKIENIATIPIAQDKISGEIVINKYNQLVWFNINLESAIDAEIVLEFAKNTYKFDNYNDDPNIQAGEDFVKAPLNVKKQFQLFLLKWMEPATAINLKLFQSNKIFFNKRIEIN